MSAPTLADDYLDSTRKRFQNTKELGDGALAQLREDEYHWTPNPEVNSIAVQIQHLHGNMLSRWTDFLTTDGDKPTRDRDGEFTPDGQRDAAALRVLWEEGWACLFHALDQLREEDLGKTVTIRGHGLSALDAIQRQLVHYGYHIGQIVNTVKELRGAEWKTLSIARGASGAYTPRKND